MESSQKCNASLLQVSPSWVGEYFMRVAKSQQ
jgi:hypothetical protein